MTNQDPAAAVRHVMESRIEFRTDDDSSDGADLPPAPPIDDAVDKLTGPEWDILRSCVNLDENDTDNAKRLLKWYGDNIQHVEESGWHLWTGTHWDAEKGRHGIERYAQSLVQKIKREAALIECSEEEQRLISRYQEMMIEYGTDKRSIPKPDKMDFMRGEAASKALSRARSSRYNFAVRSGDRSRTSAMISQAESFKSISPNDLDRDDLAINCLNGTVKFVKEEDMESDPDDPKFIHQVYFREHKRDDYFARVAGCNYDPDAKAPLFQRDLKRFMPDASTREFLQVFMGYVALGLTGEQVYAFFYGDGSNWKSAFLQILAGVMGGYFKPMSYTSVSGKNMPSGEKPSPDWARLAGVRFLTIEEVPKSEPIKEELVKLVTSGTPMPVRHLNKGIFDLCPKFTAIMTSNGEPNIRGHDKGIWRRTMIVPWDVTIQPNERLPFEEAMALYEPERSGILNWMIEGAQKYFRNGLKCYITKRMQDFTESVRADRDSVGAFIGDCVEQSEDDHVLASDLYSAFVKYCEANSIDPIINATAFGRQVKRCEVGGETMELRKCKVQGVRRFRGISLHDVPGSDQFGGN